MAHTTKYQWDSKYSMGWSVKCVDVSCLDRHSPAILLNDEGRLSAPTLKFGNQIPHEHQILWMGRLCKHKGKITYFPSLWLSFAVPIIGVPDSL